MKVIMNQNSIIQMSQNLYQYIIDQSLREHDVLKKLRTYTENELKSIKQISPDQGQFLAFLVKLINAKRILEIGTFTGYSCLCMAYALPDNGKIITCDISDKHSSTAQYYWQQAKQSHKIIQKISSAIEVLQTLLKTNELFDIVFIDADKVNQAEYFEYSLQLTPQGGLIIIDNVLWKGRVVSENFNDKNTIAIRKLNTKLKNDSRIDLTIIPIGDGMTLARKL